MNLTAIREAAERIIEYGGMPLHVTMAKKIIHAVDEAEKGCPHCTEIEETNMAGRKFFKRLNLVGRPGGELCLVQDADGAFKLHYEHYEENECDVVEDFEAHNCPGCGRKIERGTQG